MGWLAAGLVKMGESDGKSCLLACLFVGLLTCEDAGETERNGTERLTTIRGLVS